MQLGADSFRILIEGLPDGFFVHDVSGRILDVNERSCVDLGYSRAELLRMTINDISSGFSPVQNAEQWANAVPGTAGTVTEIALRKDRSTFPVEISFTCQMIDGRKLFLGMARDMSQQQSARQVLEKHNDELESRVRQRTRELQEANGQLRRERERLQLATRVGGIGVWDYDIAGDLMQCDLQWYFIMGRTADQPIRSIAQFRDFIHPDDVRQATEVDLATLSELLAQEQNYQITFRIVRPDGEIRWVRSAACLLDAEQGLPGRAVGFVVDITESHVAEQRLRESFDVLQQAESRLLEANVDLELRIAERTREYDRVWSHSRDLQVVIGVDGVFRAVSPAWTRVLGHLPRQVVGRDFLEFVMPSDADSALQGLMAASSGTDLTNFQNRFRHKSGAVRWIAWHTAVGDGLVYAYGRDITSEKFAIEALERSESRLRTIFQTSYQHQALLDVDGLVLDVNSVSLHSVSLQLEDVEGMRFCDTVWFAGSPGVRDFVKDAVRRCASGEIIQQSEIAVLLPGGHKRWFDFTLRPIRDSQDEIVALVYEAVDLTDRRRAEDALRQAQKMEIVGQLTGGIAHDFGNLLQGVVLPLQLVRQLIEDGRVQECEKFLLSAIGSAERASSLSRRLLGLSRQKPPESRSLDVNVLIREVMELLYQSLGSGITLQVVEGSRWLLTADPNELENVLLNLCINGRDAMNGNGRILIETFDLRLVEPAASRRNFRAGDFVCLRVSDTGSGMSEEVITRAFEPFFTTKPNGQGTGLGLFMVYGFVQKFGGDIRVVSKPGKGTTMELLLPRSELVPE